MNTPKKRLLCTRCERPQNSCICDHIYQITNQVELIILQHPQEHNEAKNTGHLLHLCLNNSQLHVGEKFDDQFFNTVWTAPTNSRSPLPYDLLLYPQTPDEKSSGIFSAPEIDLNLLKSVQSASENTIMRLWVLDATWRKSRKMLYLNPVLQSMPRMNLVNYPASLYAIRKAHNKNQLSTLEASCYALQELEQHRIDYTPILNGFSAFIRQQQRFISPSL
jgi:DTW domain-containing protein